MVLYLQRSTCSIGTGSKWGSRKASRGGFGGAQGGRLATTVFEGRLVDIRDTEQLLILLLVVVDATTHTGLLISQL